MPRVAAVAPRCTRGGSARRLPGTARIGMRDDTDPTDIPRPGILAVLRRTYVEFKEDNLTDWAAALTYYAVLALFPAVLALVALVGIFGQYPETTNALIDIARQVSGSDSALAGAVWSASGYIGAFMRASNAIYEVPEGRAFWKLRPLQVLVTVVMVLLVALLLMALVVSGPVAQAIGDQIGLGDAAVTVYQIAKWPIMAGVVLVILAVLYYVAPSARLPRIQWLSPGAIVALVIWLIASALFAFYGASCGSSPGARRRTSRPRARRSRARGAFSRVRFARATAGSARHGAGSSRP